MRTWSAIALAVVLAATNAAAAGMGGTGGSGMMGDVDSMMRRIGAATEEGGGVPDESKGIACLPDSRRIMVSKVVGDERWMITWDAHMGMGDVSGNVVTGDGVVFLHCPVTGVTGPDPENDSLLMSCDFGDGVVSPHGWHHFDDLSLRATFFLP
ncbi:MAG TPA: hypothetical protein VFD92_19935 [Candidatus Binatia bacterium]|nr:hypothetical protein [Candidatus Binatia bacterium]